jgi:hypothetical protein
MHRIIRTALAAMGATVVVAGGSLGVAYATAPASDPAKTSSAADSDQVAALNKQADDLLAKIATLEKELATTPTATSSPAELTKQEVTTTSPTIYSASRSIRTTSPTAPPSTTSTVASSAPQRTGERDSQNGNTND